MRRYRFEMAPILVLLACTVGLSAYGQDLFEAYKTLQEHPPLTEAQKAAGEKEPIF
jgi:hypothetical protein